MSRRIAVPGVHSVERPSSIAIPVTSVAGIRDAVADGILRYGNADGMVSDLRFNARDGTWHMAFDAGSARAARAMMRMVRHGGFLVAREAPVAAGAQLISIRLQLRILIDIGVMGLQVTVDTSCAALKETFALPQADRVIREAARPAIREVRGIPVRRITIFQDRNKMIVVVFARAITQCVRIPKGMALRADLRVAGRVEPGLYDDVVGGRGGFPGSEGDVPGARAVAALAVRSEIDPRCTVLAGARVEILLLLAHVAGVAVLVPNLYLDTGRFIRIVDVEVVKPLFPNDVPGWRKDNNPAVRQL